MQSYLYVYETNWFWICSVNEDMDRNGYKYSLFILVLECINENEILVIRDVSGNKF